MITQQTKYPYIVQFGDEPLSLADMENYKAEAKASSKKKASFRLHVSIAGLGGSVSIIMLFLTAIGAALAYGFDADDKHEYIYFIVVEIILLFGFAYLHSKAKGKLDEIDWIDQCALELIDNDPELCGQLAQWVEDYPYVKEYVHKIAALDRLPTLAEFTFIDNWVQEEIKNKPVNDLKTALNLKTV